MPDQPAKIVQPLDIKDEARPHSKTGGDIEYPVMPPAEESIRECVQRGFLIDNGNGTYRANPVNEKRHKVQWGEVELVQLVEAIWPDIPPAGVPWQQVIDRARRANAALKFFEKTNSSI
jgi:hypothetical protein